MNRSPHTFTFTLLAVALSLGISHAARAGDRDWSYTYNGDGQILSANGPRTDVTDITTYVYDDSGNRISITNALGHVVLMQNHNDRGQPGLITDANGVDTLLTYHARGWLSSSTVNNATTSYSYDNEGQLLSTTLPDGSTLFNEYDAAHRLSAISNSLGERIEYALDDAGNRLGEITRAGGGGITRSLSQVFDELSRMTRLTGAAGQSTAYTYDKNGNRDTTTDANLNTTTDYYDALDRLIGSFAPLGHSVLYLKDEQDNLVEVTDPLTLVTTYSYDGLDNLKQLSSPDTGLTTYTYDAAGNRLSQTDARSVVTNYTYDALNRVTSATYPGEPAKNVTYLYDNWLYCSACNGRLSIVTDSSGQIVYLYDSHGRVVNRINNVNVPGGGTVSLNTAFTYNAAGRLTSMVYPNGQTVNYGLDAAGQVIQVTRQASSGAGTKSVASGISYQPFGPMNDITYGNGLQMSRDYDLDGLLATQTVSGKQDLIYSYDAVNNISQIDDQIDPSRTEDFSYDELARLVTATGKYGAIAYGYNQISNRMGRTINRDGQTTTETHTYADTSHRLENISIQKGAVVEQRSFIYDDNGNLIDETRADGSHMKPHYDATNRMDSVTP